jgi:hypothetical protein
MMRFVRGFVAGFLAVPLGHQIMLTLLHAVGFTKYAPWHMAPVPPFGVPMLLSQAFWGGVWGIVFALIEPRFPRRPALYWPCVFLFGGIALTLVFIVAVLPIKGPPPVADPPAIGLTMALLVNGAWGVVTAVLLKLSRRIF